MRPVDASIQLSVLVPERIIISDHIVPCPVPRDGNAKKQSLPTEILPGPFRSLSLSLLSVTHVVRTLLYYPFAIRQVNRAVPGSACN
mmetsp:Transcript_685/g.1508  ORF Transcript_685/g.1508 Transcript_685/m.1508 type:complete len:87 (-) Transcript_685:1162-1422(-)